MKNVENFEVVRSKRGFLAGLPLRVRKRIEDAYVTGRMGTGVPIPRDTTPSGEDRAGVHPEWLYKLIEASFCVEDELEHESLANRAVVTEMRRRRNLVLDILGENERPVCSPLG